MPPPPAPECGTPGWTLTAAALYLKSYVADSDTEGNWDWGFRGSLEYERPDGLFARVAGFWWRGDQEPDNSKDDFDLDTEVTIYDIDFLVGDTFCPTESTSLELSAGLRYGKVKADPDDYDDFDSGEYKFDGWGPTFQLRGRRTLTDRIALYADLQQSFLFGEAEEDFAAFDDRVELAEQKIIRRSSSRESDTMASISEIRGGIEFLWNWNAIRNAYLRLGAEGQYWWLDDVEVGLVGATAEVGFTF